MVKRKDVRSLKATCIEAIPAFVTKQVRKLALKAGATQWMARFYADANVDQEDLLAKQAEELRNYIYSHVIW